MQLGAAGTAMLFGASLIGLWMIGVVFMVIGGLLATDAILRDNSKAATLARAKATRLSAGKTVEDVLEEYRHAS
jgi:hypothetical protein